MVQYMNRYNNRKYIRDGKVNVNVVFLSHLLYTGQYLNILIKELQLASGKKAQARKELGRISPFATLTPVTAFRLLRQILFLCLDFWIIS